MLKSKWSPGNLLLPSPVWVKVMRLVVITASPIIIANVPTMPVGLDTKYWITFTTTMVVSVVIGVGEGFKKKEVDLQNK